MQTDVRPLEVVCVHFQTYASKEINKMRRTIHLQDLQIRRLRAELFFLRVVLKACLQYNAAIANAGG